MISVQLVPPQSIRWGASLALPLLDKGLVRQKVEDKYPLAWVHQTLLSGGAQLWLVWKDSKLTAAIMTMVKEYPSGKTFIEIFLVGGWKIALWSMDAYKAVLAYAEDLGCSTLAAGGRLGWNRLVKQCEKDRKLRVDSLIAVDLEQKNA